MSQTSLGLSDAAFLEKDPAELLAEEAIPAVEEKPAEQEIESSDQTDEDKVATSEEEVSEAQEQTEATPEEKEVSQPEGDTQKAHEPFADSDTTESLDTSKKDSTETKEDTPETTEFDYESAYKKVSEPFKANGVDMQVKDPEDMIRLMQMGANYQKKMGQLKPNLKIIKMLEKNELLDEAKLHNLIDLSKKDPKAIAKLVEESDVDPLDIDKDVPTDYQPTNYSVTDKEYHLDQILDEIKDTETFSKTINVLTKEWDAKSKSTITDYPEIIGIINTHMGNGVYEKVNAVLQQEKSLGKLNGISDVEAYREIAEHLHKNGDLQNAGGKKVEPSNVSSKTDEKAETDRDKKRKAAAPVKQTATKKAPSDDNFLGLSDEDFMKKYAVR